jgi:DNA-binding transcriptional LysR family regulator
METIPGGCKSPEKGSIGVKLQCARQDSADPTQAATLLAEFKPLHPHREVTLEAASRTAQDKMASAEDCVVRKLPAARNSLLLLADAPQLFQLPLVLMVPAKYPSNLQSTLARPKLVDPTS